MPCRAEGEASSFGREIVVLMWIKRWTFVQFWERIKQRSSRKLSLRNRNKFMPVKIQKSGDVEFKPKVKMLVYGHGGVGKTTFAATGPTPLFGDCEGGTSYFGRKGISVDVCRLSSWDDLESFLSQIKNVPNETIVIDPVNEVLEKLLVMMKDNPKFSNKVEGLSLQAWGVAKDKIRVFLKTLRDLDKHIIVIAHVDEKADDQGSLKKRPKLGANMSQELIDMVDVVAYMTVAKGIDGTVKRILRVQPESDAFEAKDRSGVLGEIVEPDFKKIIEAIVENKQFSWTKKLEQGKADNAGQFEDSLKNTGVLTPPVTVPLDEPKSEAGRKMKEGMKKVEASL